MIVDNPINEDYRVQSLRMRFNSIVQQNKLIIQATCEGDNSQYTGKVAQNPHFSFNQLVQHLEARTFEILSKNQDILRLKIMQQEVELYSMSRLQLNELKQTTRVLNQRQDEFRLMIHAQIHQLNNIKEQKKKMEIKEIQELKDDLKKSVQRQQKYQTIFQSQNDSIQDVKDQINKFKLQIRKTTEQIKKINENSLQSEVMKITAQINEVKNQTKKSIQKLRDDCEIEINEKQKNIIKNPREIDKVMREMRQISSFIGFEEQEKLGLIDNKDQRVQQLQKVQRISDKFFNYFVKKSQIIEYKWSPQLKSKAIDIKGNIITNTKSQGYSQFCLLNASFSNSLKQKQSWTIKINKMARGIQLGVCLKSKMIKYNFNGQNINCGKTGHGLYMIGPYGFCSSHSQKEFNCVFQSFNFGEGDVIQIEYDPIESKLRFSKNKGDKYFEMPIIAPPQNDAYHPCVALHGYNDSVELMHPAKSTKQVNDQKNKGFWQRSWGLWKRLRGA